MGLNYSIPQVTVIGVPVEPQTEAIGIPMFPRTMSVEQRIEFWKT